MSGHEAKSNALQKAHADAYRAYLHSLKESLAKIDIEAVDLSTPQATRPPSLGTFFSIQTWYTWYTFHTYHTLGCEHSIAQ